MKKNTSKLFKIIFIALLTFTAVWINYIFIRPQFPMIGTELRYIDHLISAIAVPYILYLWLGIDIKFWASIYFVCCIAWEFYQFIIRGYFQFDQLLFDLLGVLIIYIITSRKKVMNN